MKLGICPNCKGESVHYQNKYFGKHGYCDVLVCETAMCGFYARTGYPGFEATMAQVFPPDTTTFYTEDAPIFQDGAGYWDNRCAAISPVVGRVSGCGSRVTTTDPRD